MNAYVKVPGRWEGWLVSFLKPAPVRVDGTQEAPSFKEMHRILGTAEGAERQAWRQQVGEGWRTV